MNDLPPFWVMPLGLLAGFMCTPFLTHWIQLLLVAIGKDPTSPPIPGSRIGPIIVTIIHPVPWLLIVGIPVVIFRAISEPPSEEWLWFSGSALMSVVALFAYGFYVSHRMQRAAKNNDQPGKTNG